MQILKENAETDFEKLSVARLETALTNPPLVEIIDDTHQSFNGVTFSKNYDGYYSRRFSLHCAVWFYYNGKMPPQGYQLHHKDFGKENNNIENLLLLTNSEHSLLHNFVENKKPTLKTEKKIFICENCGKEYEAFDTGANRFCSRECKVTYHQEIRKCAFCGKEFSIFDNSLKKYCSLECSKGMRHALHFEKRVCPVCGKEFEIKKSRKNVCCSLSCSGKLREAQRRGGAIHQNDTKHNESVTS